MKDIEMWEGYEDEWLDDMYSPDVDEKFIEYVENGCGSKGENDGIVFDENPKFDGSIITILFRLWEKQSSESNMFLAEKE